ncbi:MAG: LamG domain-containing protein [Candidatus Howiella sp.]|jgi:hypothetical protein
MCKSRRIFAFLLSLSMVLSMFAVVPSVTAVISEDDVILRLDFSNYTGGAISDEISGKTLMEAGLEAVSGRDEKQAAKFTGEADSYIRWNSDVLDPFASTENGVTISMWVNFSTVGDWIQYFAYIKDKEAEGEINGFLMQLGGDADIGRANVIYHGNQKATGSSVSATAGEWCMVTFSQDTDKTIKMYINGEMVASATADETLYAISQKSDTVAEYDIGGPVSVARDMWSYDSKLNGLMESFTMYGRALTALEIARLYDPNAGLDEAAIENAAGLIAALDTPAGTAEYLAAYQAAKAAYDALTTAEKDDARLSGATAALSAAYSSYCALYTEANGGKLASFTFEGETDAEKLTEAGGRVTLSNDASSAITLNAAGKNGNAAADFSGAASHQGLRWSASDYHPFAQTGENASISMWVKFHADTGSISGQTTIFNALSNDHSGESGYFIIKYNDNRIMVRSSAAVDGGSNDEVGVESYTYTPEKDTWVLVTYVQEGTTGKLYLNDELAGTGTMRTMASCFGTYGGSYAIGCQMRTWWGDPSLDGTVDDVTVYNRALSLLEIAELAGGVSIDEEAVKAVEAKITAIGTVTLSADSLALLETAKAAYAALSDVEKLYVTNYTTLTEGFATYYTLAEAANDGLLLYFDFEDGTATDVAGRVTASVSGVTEVEGRESGTKAFQFGTDKSRSDALYVKWAAADYDPFSRTEENGASITTWVKLSETDNWATLFSYGKGNSFFVAVPQADAESGHNSAFRAAVKNNGSSESDVVGQQITTEENLGQWVLLTITQDADRNTKLYIDGTLLGEAQLDYSLYALSSTNSADSMTYSIGYVPFFGDDNFQGAMDDFAIYNRALTAEEIAALASDLADYTAVDAALDKAAALTEGDYTEASWAKLQTAVNAVVRDLTASEQATVDGYAAAIEAAILALVPASVEMNLTIGTGMVTAAAEGKYDITWNAHILPGEGLTVEDINQSGLKVKNYGVYYATGKDVLADYKNASADQIRKIVFAQGEDVDVYTSYGFRLKNVAENRVRAAMFYIEYELNGQSYILLSTVDEVVAVIAE